MAIPSPGHMMETKWRAALYLDERASDPQRQALTRIFAGQAGGHPEGLGLIRRGRAWRRERQDRLQAAGKKRSLSIPDIVSAEIEAIDGQGGGDVTIRGHPLCVAPGEPAVVARSKRLDYTDHQMTWSISDCNGFYLAVRLPGRLTRRRPRGADGLHRRADRALRPAHRAQGGGRGRPAAAATLRGCWWSAPAGLGCPVALYLAAAGVGTIGVVDDDVVSLSNLQRQIAHATARIGVAKTASAAAAIAAINPDVRVIEHRRAWPRTTRST